MALTRWSQGSVHPGDRRLRHGTAHDQASGLPIPAVRCGGQEAGARHAASFGPRQPILRPYVQEFAEPLRDARLDERQGQLLRQRAHGKFLGHAEDRTRFSSAIRNPAAGYVCGRSRNTSNSFTTGNGDRNNSATWPRLSLNGNFMTCSSLHE